MQPEDETRLKETRVNKKNKVLSCDEYALALNGKVMRNETQRVLK